MLFMLFTALLAVSSFAAPENVKRDVGPPVVPNGWTALGCYTDASDARTLLGASTTSTDLMTLAVCTNFCTYKYGVFRYAGVEYGQQCWCGNVMNPPSGPVSSGCEMSCSGNPGQQCGGPLRLFIAERNTSSVNTCP